MEDNEAVAMVGKSARIRTLLRTRAKPTKTSNALTVAQRFFIGSTASTGVCTSASPVRA